MSLLKAFIKDAGFGISVLLMALAIGVALVTLPIFGNKALVVRSGSMQPTIGVGDLIAVQNQKGLAVPQNIPVPKYKVGDIIAFKDQTNPKIVTTHRILSSQIKDGKVYYNTKGDANNTADSKLVWEENVIGNAQYSVKGIGKIFAFAKSRAGLVSMIIFPALMVIIMEAVNLFRELKIRPGFFNRQANFPNSVGLKVLIPLLAVVLTASSTFAYFSNSAASTNNVFAAAQSFGVRAGDVVINEINWGGSSQGGDDEWIELRNVTNQSIDISGWVVENLGSGSGSLANITIPSGKTIPANGFFLISRFDKDVSKVNVDSDFVTTSPVISLVDTGEQLRLKTGSSGTLIDLANGASGLWFFGVGHTLGPAKSMERKTPPGDGTVSTNWQTATTHTNMDGLTATDEFGTPKAVNGL